jgi:hypothetical protein
VTYGRAFFDLQLELAVTVARLAAIPLARAVLDYTNVYIRLGLGHGFDTAHPVWRDYVAGLASARAPGAWTHRFFLTRPRVPPPGVVATSGCFAYARRADGSLRIHFANVEPDGGAPLALERQAQRVAELGALFAAAKRSEAPSAGVVGASWLYNLDAYRRLFPKPYLATARAMPGVFRHLPLWGQFLDRAGQVRAAPAQRFRERIARLTSIDALDDCFPLPVLRLEAPVAVFYDWYGV